MIKALIFDVNDTLDENLNVKLKAMRNALKSSGINVKKELVDKIMVDIKRIDLRNPQLGMDKIVYMALDRFRVDLKTKKRIYEEYASQREKGKDINKEFLRMLPALAKRYILILYTSASRNWTEAWLKKHNIKKYFVKTYISHELDTHKPSIEAYEIIFRDINLKADECIMIGDDVTKDLFPAKML
jgi:HAD superfamily hydrolase (TIGR01549 family)